MHKVYETDRLTLRILDEGLAQSYLRIDGKWEDHIHMVLRNEKLE